MISLVFIHCLVSTYRCSYGYLSCNSFMFQVNFTFCFCRVQAVIVVVYLLSFIVIIVVTSAIIIILFVITNAEQYVTLVIVTNCFIKNTFYD